MNTKRVILLTLLILTLHITHYTSVVYPATKGNPPVAHWRFDDAGGPTAYDESTNNNDGTLTAGALGSQTAAGQMWYPQGKIGAALEFDGTDDYVNMGDVNAFDGLSDMSYSFWAKSTSSAPVGYALSKSYLNFAFIFNGSQSAVIYFSNSANR